MLAMWESDPAMRSAPPVVRIDLADRDKCSEHHQDGPIDSSIGLAEGERSEENHKDGGCEEGRGDGEHPESRQRHCTAQDRNRNNRFPHVAQADLSLGQRQAPEFSQLIG